jgi:HEAT repeat protein
VGLPLSLARRILVIWIAGCAPAVLGCSAWLNNGGSQGLSGGVTKSSQAATSAADNTHPSGESAIVADNDSGTAGRVPEGNADATPTDQFNELAAAEWVLAPAQPSEVDRLLNPFAEPKWPARRWRHFGLEAMLSRADAARHLKTAARARDKTIAINAAIGLAQIGDTSSLTMLADTAASDHRPRSMRGAAIESLALMKVADADTALERLADVLGNWEGTARSRYNPDLHADVVRALSIRPSAKGGYSLVAALGSPSAEVRNEAALAYERLAGSVQLPAKFADLVGDESARVRAAVVRALVACRDASAGAAVERALMDEDLGVRIAAVHSLSELGGAANHDRLRGLLDDSSELIRAAAVQATVRLNDIGSASQAAGDKSWRVRLALAASLARIPPRYGSPIAMQLIGDVDLKVQRRAVQSIATWPAYDAIPLLLSAAERGSVLARRDAIEQLQRQRPAAESFPLYTSADRQLDEIRRLRQQWEQEANGRTAADAISQDARITAHEEARAIDVVTSLAAGSLAERRAAARRLSAEYHEKPLPPAAVEKLAELIEAEPDGQLWIDVMRLVARSNTVAAAQIASAGASHANSEVRRRACGWFAAHTSDLGADVLINSLDDEDASVVLAAVVALGLQSHVSNLDRLERLLTADDHLLRVAAAESLARLGSPAGFQALSRLTYDPDAKVRRLAATAVGNVYAALSIENTLRHASASAASGAAIGDQFRAQFVNDLVQLLDGRTEVRRAAVIALAKVTGEEPPKTAGTPPSRAFGALPDEAHDTAAAAAWWKQRFAISLNGEEQRR